MKNQFSKKVWVTIICSVLVTIACNKEKSHTGEVSQPGPTNLNTVRASGVVEDDPAKVAKIPMIISSDFLKIGEDVATASATARLRMQKGGTDRTAPSVSITSPANGVTVSGNITVQATASDNVGISSVMFSVDGALIATSSTAPYSFPWNSATVANGTHTLTVTAKDFANNPKSASIQVTTNNTSAGDITNPSVTITSPANGASVSGAIDIAANATDNVGVSAVSYSVDGAAIGSDNSAPYSISWNSGSVAAGVHTLTASATDAAGNVGSYSIQVTVNTTVLPPTNLPSSVQLVTPTPGNQGGESSCVAFAVGYGARSIEQFYKTNATAYGLELNIFSPEYLYNQTKFSDCASGTAFTIALDLIKNQGISTWQSMPYSDLNGCSLLPNATQSTNASAFKISSYVTVPNTDRVAIKTMIATKHPVIVNIIADNGFINARPGFIWNSNSGGTLPHAIVICGYDDAKHAYKIMNSYGTGWGDAGFTWIDYDYFPQISSYYTYVIQ